MCLTIISSTKPEPLIATKDIVCYKHLTPNRISEFQGYEYSKGAIEKLEYEMEPHDTYEDKDEYEIHKGFHSWEYKPRKHSYYITYKCIIPKGAKYYKGIQYDEQEGYVSDSIIIKHPLIYEGFLSFLNYFM